MCLLSEPPPGMVGGSDQRQEGHLEAKQHRSFESPLRTDILTDQPPSPQFVSFICLPLHPTLRLPLPPLPLPSPPSLFISSPSRANAQPVLNSYCCGYTPPSREPTVCCQGELHLNAVNFIIALTPDQWASVLPVLSWTPPEWREQVCGDAIWTVAALWVEAHHSLQTPVRTEGFRIISRSFFKVKVEGPHYKTFYITSTNTFFLKELDLHFWKHASCLLWWVIYESVTFKCLHNG